MSRLSRLCFSIPLFLFLALPAIGLARDGKGKSPSNTRSIMKDRNQPNACSISERSACGTTPWQGKSDKELRKTLTREQYRIARQAGTEAPFSGKYWNTHTPGTYHCAVCGQPLFSSKAKFESGTGWPSFFQPVSETALASHSDASHGMVRTEIRCARCDSHLGHLFDDGPPPTGLRYCMNSAVLNLVPEKK